MLSPGPSISKRPDATHTHNNTHNLAAKREPARPEESHQVPPPVQHDHKIQNANQLL